jgi:hypothetical protein
MSSSSINTFQPAHVLGCACDQCSLVNIKPLMKFPIPRAILQKHGRGFNGLKPTKAKLWSTTGITQTAANTALNLLETITFAPGTFPEINNWILIYDECRMLSCKVHYEFDIAVEPTAATASAVNAAAAITFDAAVASPSNLYGVMEESFNTGPLYIGSKVSTSTQRKMGVLSASPGRSLAPVTSSDCPGNAWFIVDSATPPTMFVGQYFASAAGAAGTTRITRLYELDVEFRIRT